MHLEQTIDIRHDQLIFVIKKIDIYQFHDRYICSTSGKSNIGEILSTSFWPKLDSAGLFIRGQSFKLSLSGGLGN